jgi:prefoldin beta subunit
MVEKERITAQAQEKIQELQLLQQRLAVFAQQKQAFQLQMMELENALAEVEKSKGPFYKMVGEILVEKTPEELKKLLQERKTDIDIRIKSFDKQESKTREQAQELQKEVAKVIKA